MRKNFAKSALFILTIILSTAFTNRVSAQTTLEDLLFGNSKSRIFNVSAPSADQFFAGDGSALTAAKWGPLGGPYTSTFTSGNVANFAVPNGTASGAGGITVSGIVATEDLTYSSPTGTLSTGGTVAPITVSAGKTLNLSTLNLSTAAGTGFIKNGLGTFFTANGNTYGGGFTLNAGTVVAGSVNALGGGATNTLTINGGTIAADATRTFTNKFPNGITIGGDFQLGALSTAIPLSSNTANLTFTNDTALGAATRTITIGANGNYTFSGVISGAFGSGLTITNLAGTTGRVTLSGVNTYNGNTTINGGTLALSVGGSIAQSPVITIGGGATFDVSALTTPLTLTSGQGLTASGTTSSGTIATSAANGLTLASDSPLKFTAFNGSTPPLTITGAGTLALQSGNPVTVTVSNGGTPLGAGDYILISKGTSGGVTGTAPTSLTVNGDGIAMGTTASLQIVNGSLILRVVAAPATAATVNVGGRVIGAKGRGISGALVTMTDGNGNSYSAVTNSSGDYLFEDVEVGQTLIFNVRAKRYTFAEPTQVVSLSEETITVNFTGVESRRSIF